MCNSSYFTVVIYFFQQMYDLLFILFFFFIFFSLSFYVNYGTVFIEGYIRRCVPLYKDSFSIDRCMQAYLSK